MNDIYALVSLYKEPATYLIASSFVFAGAAVVKKLVGNYETAKMATISYIVALVVFLALWSLI